ncbi:hypothetical protein CEUSTIGMA_g10197.t1 [Chlamydomonas eustigma]|uniref:Uncharacterized protein n=1 Tax=Chlamydomonas eustigma TaxID=1157962 RepID=A0A250XI65_9CHLO|nr:hypothetical protein CEUSTIGMA_g10197.t1 [Chlamydomonas eustigma]|eukprot:GAX82771.1 hypothetical protein CEUSTIGMA_g10197.t1 [Chlamydomonas eustigma]
MDLEALPDELLLQIFRHLSEKSPDEVLFDFWFIKHMKFRNDDHDEQPYAGLRAYPFLGQVCKKWNRILATDQAKAVLWSQIVIDFGHELVTAIHTPLVWSNERPNAEEYAIAFQRVSLSSAKVIDFISQRQKSLKSLVLTNSEGFWGDEGDYLPLSGKHNFNSSHLGFLVGQMRYQLQELRLFNCNDLLSSDLGLWGVVTLCPNLRIFAAEGLNFRLPSQYVSELGNLMKLESLSLVGEEHIHASTNSWIVGLDKMPEAWSRLCSLSKLELRGHHLLDMVPTWLPALPALRHLDLSLNASINLQNLSSFDKLETLVLQSLDLSQPAGAEQISLLAKRFLPNLEGLSGSLKSISLAGNRFTSLPEMLMKLGSLNTLDFNGNKELQILGPLTGFLASWPGIQVLDFRGVHKDKNSAYWSDAKCTTMKFVAAAAKLLKRRKYHSRVLIDRD